MGCFGDREKGVPDQTAKWSYLTLNDFKCTSTWSALAYGWLWFMAIVAVAVFCVDTFTAVNLLFYNKWSSQVQPALPFKYSRWIFAGCIMLSWVLYIYEWQRALRVIQRDGVAESYMDPLAVSLQSMRSKGWRRFLVFTELTKSKKGTDYTALFAYFAFQGALRVIFAEGPRQGINAMTLYAVLTADILKTGDHVAIVQFFLNIQALAEENGEQAAIYFSMLFTLIIWTFSALSLITAALLYIIFLWHYIPSADGRLSKYCRRKIDKRLERIVEHKVKAALEEEERVKRKAERKELKRQQTDLGLKAPIKPQVARQPTLPALGASPEVKQDEKSSEFSLSRQGTDATVSTLPLYESRPSTAHENRPFPKQPSLHDGISDNRRPMPPSRAGTTASGWSNNRPGIGPRTGTQASSRSNPAYADEAPLLANAGYAGDSGLPPSMPPPVFNRQGSSASFHQPQEGFAPGGRNMQSPGGPSSPMSRNGTPASNRPFTPMSANGMGPRRPFTPMSADGANAPRPFSPMSAGTALLGRPFSPMSRAEARTPGPSFTPGPNSGSYYPSHPPGPRVPPGQNGTEFSFGFEPQSSIDPPIDHNSFRPPPPRQASVAPSFSRGGPPSRYPTNGSISSQQSFNRPAARQTSTTSFGRASPSAHESQMAYNSYEMTSQPLHSQPPPPPSKSGGYVAFNPNMRNASSTPFPAAAPASHSAATSTPATLLSPFEAPRRGVAITGGPGTEESYFGHVREVSMLSASNAAPEPRHSVAPYDDILDSYGSMTSAEPSPQPPSSLRSGPPPPLTPAESHAR